MKLIIKDVNKKEKSFYCYINGKKVGFYLTNRLAKIFLDSLEVGVLVDFEVQDHLKSINKQKHHQVLHFNQIKKLNLSRSIYNHQKLKKQMIEFLKENKNYLFLDLEMTIPFPGQKRFIPEIVQYGLYLTDLEGNVILEDGNYLQTIRQTPVSRRTFKFLSLKEEVYNENVKSYYIFYNLLKEILLKYNPKIIVWGKNDIITMNHSYNLHKVLPLTTRNDFVDLLKLHKDYFNLKNDLGLFKAYEVYYEKSFPQTHDAKDDAKVTKQVFDAFLEYSTNELKNS